MEKGQTVAWYVITVDDDDKISTRQFLSEEEADVARSVGNAYGVTADAAEQIEVDRIAALYSITPAQAMENMIHRDYIKKYRAAFPRHVPPSFAKLMRLVLQQLR